jgi:hypothetical protein
MFAWTYKPKVTFEYVRFLLQIEETQIHIPGWLMLLRFPMIISSMKKGSHFVFLRNFLQSIKRLLYVLMLRDSGIENIVKWTANELNETVIWMISRI